MNRSTAYILNILALYTVSGVLLSAFAMQFALGELPCPLCMLQRVFICALAIGPILNLRFGPRPGHYALSMLAAMAGAAVAVRQMFLHILPGDPGYGSAIFGYHYYTWAFVIFAIALLVFTLLLLFEQQFENDKTPKTKTAAASVAVWLTIAVTAANVVSTFAICGPTECPDNPVRYELFQRR